MSAYRSALAVTGNNIAKVGVDGYSRQSATLDASVSIATNIGYMGTGVETKAVERSYDKFLTNQLNSAISGSSNYGAYHNYASMVDEMVADPEIGMTPSMVSFFNSTHDLASAPSSMTLRQTMFSEGESLVGRFNRMYDQLDGVRTRAKTEFKEVISTANGLAKSIANMNFRIDNASASGATPNDLMDQRDMLVKSLSENFSITNVKQGNMVNIYIGKGELLVGGADSNTLSVGEGDYKDSGDLSIIIDKSGNKSDITSTIKGGKSGGILDVSREILDSAQSSLGRIALSLAATFNAQHRDGYGMGGSSDTGNNFFNIGTVSSTAGDHAVNSLLLGGVAASTKNTSGSTLTISIPMDTGTTGGVVGAGQEISGLTINGKAIDTVAANASANAAQTASDLAAQINAKTAETNVTATVVESGKIRLTSDTDIVIAGTDADSGLTAATHRVSKDAIRNLTGDDYEVSYNGTDYTITNRTNKVSDTVTLANLNSGLIKDGLTIKLNGTMNSGESFLVSATRGSGRDIKMSLNSSQLGSIAASDAADESGNNFNMLKISSLQSEKLMMATTSNRGTATLQDGYGQMVAEVGVQAHYADVNYNAQESIRKYAQTSRDDSAAVNLDEEAANLMKYQQMFQASARLISISDKMLQEVLNAVR
ncbi:MAG: flagellar hook-associated protein FlgK [Thiotrichales bacterium]|jgi:flagellar hook-associated protein 1 FlgK|nr:flagellar hook-associated protein FlgK [Thiotrichales bacterium]MBT3613503.1 flagellar hook-associated protein FlgK [Thiotrichales bacterium]MBT5291221.1 flagellar hook-associated protein FlgK [Thiotrichales bacterium]MBT5417977.1 flagellar hook-associated protein FlgK [Thiotrichales bacterium]